MLNSFLNLPMPLSLPVITLTPWSYCLWQSVEQGAEWSWESSLLGALGTSLTPGSLSSRAISGLFQNFKKWGL